MSDIVDRLMTGYVDGRTAREAAALIKSLRSLLMEKSCNEAVSALRFIYTLSCVPGALSADIVKQVAESALKIQTEVNSHDAIN